MAYGDNAFPLADGTATQMSEEKRLVGNHLESVPCNLCGSPSEHARMLFEKLDLRVVRCRQCGLVYVCPRLIQQELWKRYSQEYFDNEYLPSQGPFDAQSNLARYRPLLQKLRGYVPAGRNLLDVGCATGYFLEAARQDGWQVTGTEISEYAAEYARQKFGLEVLTAKIEEAQLPLGKYDAVTMWEVLEHLQNPMAALSAIHAVMSPGGVIGISSPNFASLTYLLVGKEWWVIGPTEHIYYFTLPTLRKMLEQVGFQMLEIVAVNVSLRYVRDQWIQRLPKWRTPAVVPAATANPGGQPSPILSDRSGELRRRVMLAIHVRVRQWALQHGRGDTLIAYARKPLA
jgi:2-polyprenyl-3-methyl-5-hydroxy-6-metoxy-1,4-benzoquinol methylase